ncbi:MAG: class IV adenylate cyclase [Terriglobales bacterium]|jgi:adenylate cyclase class 2
MALHKEIEIKFIVADPPALRNKLRKCGFCEVTPRTREMNSLYDTPRQDLRRRGELLRIRRYGVRWVLTHKAKAQSGRHKSRVETETGIDNGSKLALILLALGFQSWFRYEKFRSEWSDGKGHVVIDETPIGWFSEIEGPPRWIDATAKRLGVPREQYLTSNYAQMFLDWKARTGSDANEMTFKATKAGCKNAR